MLLLSPASRSRLSAGRLYNLAAADTSTLNELCGNAMGLVSAPLRIGVALVLLHRHVGGRGEGEGEGEGGERGC